MQLVKSLDVVSEHLDSHSKFLVLGNDLDGVTLDTELSTREVNVVAFILHPDELSDDVGPADLLTDLERNHRLEVFLGRPQSVNAGNR